MIEIEAIFQYIGCNMRRFLGKDIFVVLLSDGFFKTEFTLKHGSEQLFQLSVRICDVIQIKFYLNSQKDLPLLCMSEFNVLYHDLTEQIGEPIPFVPNSGNQKNDKGSCEIPRAVIDNQRTLNNLPEIPKPVTEMTVRPVTSTIIEEPLRKREEYEFVTPHYNLISELKALDKSWMIKARILNKQELRPFRKNQGEYFSVILSDNSGKIRATFFKNMATLYYPVLKEGGVYTFTGGEVEKASSYNNTNCRFEIIFKENTEVVEQHDYNGIPENEYNFVKISDAFKMPDNALMDVLAVVKDPGELEIKELKRGGTKDLRRICLIDTTEKVIEINIWGDIARTFLLEKNEIYIFKNMKLKTFNDVRYFLWENFSKVFYSNYPARMYEELVNWRNQYLLDIKQPEPTPVCLYSFESNQKGLYVSLSELNKKCDEFFGQSYNLSKRVYFEFTAFIDGISRMVWYECCGYKGCKKKVLKIDRGYYCDKCRQELSDPVIRFMADVKLVDGNDYIYGRMFGDENCLGLFGKSILDVKSLREISEATFIKMIKEIEKSEYTFRVIAKMNLYQGEERLSIEILNVVPIERVAEFMTARVLENLTQSPLLE